MVNTALYAFVAKSDFQSERVPQLLFSILLASMLLDVWVILTVTVADMRSYGHRACQFIVAFGHVDAGVVDVTLSVEPILDFNP